ncbi:GtrA family protein [Rhodoferax ferrireducens]|uniref:GtrA family protein n=1 Tax=Rhodoferax ferrireducens TaxID=192843 RepID=UPI0018E50085|nr:GtrA family protein [Rhodoferax ferrireducens]
MKRALTQLVRYTIVGLASNAIGYVLYLVLTRLGLGPKLAMSLLYGIGVLQTFVFNKKWSFRFNGAAAPALVRYATVYALGYVINFLAFILLVDQAGLPHQWVMAGLVLFMAVFFFAGQKFWVFRQTPVPGLRGRV